MRYKYLNRTIIKKIHKAEKQYVDIFRNTSLPTINFNADTLSLTKLI